MKKRQKMEQMKRERQKNNLNKRLSNLKEIQRFCMEQYGWTLTEVKNQPYIELLTLLNSSEKEEMKEESEQKVYTGRELKYLFGS